MIKLNQMSYSIPNAGDILKNINLSISAGDFIGLLGKNGAGKTTLIDIMMGFRSPSKGSVLILGQNPVSSDRSVFKEIAYLSQDVTLKDNISIEFFLNFHKYFFSNYSKHDEKKINGYI